MRLATSPALSRCRGVAHGRQEAGRGPRRDPAAGAGDQGAEEEAAAAEVHEAAPDDAQEAEELSICCFDKRKSEKLCSPS